MEALVLANSICKCFLIGPRQLPPVSFDGYVYHLDVHYIGERFTESSDDLPKLLGNWAIWSEKTLQKHNEQKHNEKQSNQLQPLGE